MVKFYVDAMLGKFGKTLRMLGFDTLIALPSLTDTEILEICLKENRFLVTNDRRFHERFPNKVNSDGSEAKSLLMDSTAPQPDQLKSFFEYFKIDSSFIDLDNPESLNSRCTNCNGSLQKVQKNSIKDKVNFGTYESQDNFWVCKDCEQIYWIGSHWNNIKKTLETLNNGP